MNKYEFIAAIREGLNGLAEEDIDRSLDYYREMVDDGIEDGLTECEAVAALGPVEKIVADIRGGAVPSTEVQKTPAAPEVGRGRAGAEKGRAVAAAGAAALLGSILGIVHWCLAIALVIATASLFIGAGASIISCFVLLFTGDFLNLTLFLGGGLAVCGIALLFSVATYAVIKYGRMAIGKITGNYGKGEKK